MAKYQFDSHFLSNFQKTLDLNQRKQEMMQDIALKQRQLSLLDKRSQQNYELGLRQEDRLETGQKLDKEATEYNISKDFDTTHPWTKGAITGGEFNKQFGGLLNPLSPTKFYKEKTQPDGIERTVTLDKNGRPYIYGVTDTGKKIELGRGYEKPDKDKTTTTNESDFKEGKLSEAGAKALGFFTQPGIDKPNFFQNIFGTGTYTDPEKVKTDIADKLATLAKDIMGSDSYKYIRNTFDAKGYITPEELKKQAIADAEKEGLTGRQANEIAVFLNYYDTMYDGIKSLEDYIK